MDEDLALVNSVMSMSWEDLNALDLQVEEIDNLPEMVE